jgi:hypothetical protein
MASTSLSPPAARLQLKPFPNMVGLALAGFAFLLASCNSTETAASTAQAKQSTFVLNEFTIKLGQSTLPSGRVNLTATNVGVEEHELVLVKASAVADLPVKIDGSVDEDQIPKSAMMGEIEEVRAGQTKSADFELPPGTYVAFCNLVDQMGTGSMMEGPNSNMSAGMGGHVHFARGMYEMITVK